MAIEDGVAARSRGSHRNVNFLQIFFLRFTHKPQQMGGVRLWFKAFGLRRIRNKEIKAKKKSRKKNKTPKGDRLKIMQANLEVN